MKSNSHHSSDPYQESVLLVRSLLSEGYRIRVQSCTFYWHKYYILDHESNGNSITIGVNDIEMEVRKNGKLIKKNSVH